MMSLLGAGLALVGGLLGSKSSGGTQTAEKKMDPRLDRYVYGEDGQGGLLGAAFDLAQNQLKTGGLNDLQRQGLEMQRQYLMSPQYSQGYTNMANLGQSLMGGGVASNPFTAGGKTAGNPYFPTGTTTQGGFQYQGLTNAQLPTYNTTLQAQTQSPALSQGLLSQSSGGGSGDGYSSGVGQTLGTGKLSDAITQQAKDTFQSYLALGIPAAVAASLVQSAMATNQGLSAVNQAADPIEALNAIQGWTDVDPGYDAWGGGSGGGGWGSGMGADGHGGLADSAMGGGYW